PIRYTSTACQNPWQPKSKSKNKNFHLRKKQKLSELPGPPHTHTRWELGAMRLREFGGYFAVRGHIHSAEESAKFLFI
ncbi:MAG: hypothetical protein ABR987_20715, partial [Terracidiphilus sp.]